MKKAAICVVLVFLLGNIFAQTTISLTPDPAASSVELRDKFKDYTLVRVDYESLYEEHLQNDGLIDFVLEGFDRRNLNFTITPWELRSENYFRQIWNGERSERQAVGRTATYRGSLAEDSGAEAYFTIDRQFVLGSWDIDEETYFLEPLRHLDATADHNLYVVYRAADAIMSSDFCGVTSVPGGEIDIVDDGKDDGPEKAGDCYLVEIALAADFELYEFLGDDETSVENFMLNGLMNVQTNYDNEFADEIQFEVVTIYIATCSTSGCDPWINSISAGLLLDDFVEWGNDGNFGVNYDVATLWTGRNFSGSTIGVAYVGAVCTNQRYNTCQAINLSEQELRVLWAHELGHNFNCDHDDALGFIMSPSVSTTTIWSSLSINTVNNYLPTRNCLSGCPVSGPPLAFIEAAYEEACEGSYIAFFDDSDGNVTERFWDFDGGIPSTSTDAHPIVFFPDGGSYYVSLSVQNAQGSDFTNFTVDIDQDDAFPKVLYYENFEDGFGGWDVENPDNNIGWDITSVNGNLGDNAAYVNNYDYDAAGQIDALISPFFDLSEQTEIRFSFEYAYARYNNSLNDDLRVSLSTDGGSSFPNILFESGSNFATAADNLNPFVPNGSADWCNAGPGCIDLDLAAYAGESDVVIKIENITGFGNNMYIDNIALTASCAPAFPPIANFSQDEVIGCAPLTVSFIDQSSGLIEFREWEFPGGSPDYTTEPNPIIVYNTPGVYDVTIFVENSAGSDGFTDLDAVTVLGSVIADFIYSNDENTYVFTSLSGGDVSTYEWDFGDGEISNEINPTHTFEAPGTYTVTLRVENDCSSDLFFEVIEVEALLTADFEADITTGCAPLAVQFADLSAGDPDSWDWSFPGGNPSSSSDPNPIITYTTSGTYDVSLTVTGGSLTESLTFSDYISVGVDPVAQFTVDNTPGSLVVSLQDQSNDANTISWNFGDGNMASGNQTSYTYDSPGTYTITQTVENECGTDVATQMVTLILPVDPTFTASATNGCTPQSISFTASPQEAGNSYSWTFEGGDPATSNSPNPTVNYTTAGSFNVSLTITNAAGPATSTLADYITIGTGPTAAFMATATPGSLVVSLEDQSSGATNVSWTFGDGNMASGNQTSYTYDSPGTYTITQTVENECGTDVATQMVTLILPVDPTFTASATNGCTPQSISFTASPQEAGNSYSWTFEGGDPATSNSPNPTVNYTTAGSFNVSLTITNAAGPASITQSDYVTIGTGPIAAFTATATPGSLVVGLDDQSSGASTVSWDFGDGNMASGNQTSYTYDSPGTYTITQTVENECGTDIAMQVVTLILPVDPVFTASATNGCTPQSISFTASPQEAGNSYSWTFEGGDPATSNNPNPTVNYTTAGSFNVSLTITNAAGPATSTLADYITIGTGPTAAFAATSTPGSLVVSLEDQSSGATSISWTFGDGNMASGNQTSYTYDSPGTYTITQTVENECGTDIAMQVVTLILPVDPVFTASTTNGCTPLTVNYTASPQEAGNNYSWTFEGGDPATSNNPNPTVNYTTAGSFNVSLTITNAAGPASITQTDYVSVGLGPLASFVSVNTAGEAMVSFTNNSEGADSYSWDFGDDSGSILPNPTHTYAEAGTYEVSLTASNACGTDTYTETVTIVFPPSAAFTQSSQSGCAPHSITYTAQDQSPENTYSWTFVGGTPTTSNAVMPTVTYETAGTYSVSLSVTNAAGMMTELREEYIDISTVPNEGFELNTTLGSLTIDVDGPINDGTNEWLWNFGDGTERTSTSAVHTYASSGTYTITLMATNACGTTSSEQTVTVLTAPEATFMASSLTVCPGEMITLLADEVGDDITYDWSTPAGMPISASTRMHNVSFANPGTYMIELTVSNSVGSNSSQQMVTVEALPTASFDFNVNGLTVSTQNNSTNADTYNWIYEGGNSMEAEPDIIFGGVGAYEITLIAANACGEATTSQSVSIQGSIPEVNFTATNNEGCGPLSVSFTSEIENADSFSWSFQGGEPATSTAPNPVIVYNTPGTYPVTLTASNAFGGNAITQEALVTVLAPVTADFDYTLNGTTASFSHSVTGTSNILWTFPDGSTSPMNAPTYTFPGNGSYAVSLQAVGPCNTETIDQTIIIDGPLPVVELMNTTTKGCAPFTITFTDNSTQSPTSWNWDLPGGSPETSDEASVDVTYSEMGVYTVGLSVTNIYGTTTQEWIDYVEVIDVPATPEFSEETFDNISYAFDVIGVMPEWAYSWDFGDGNTAEGTSTQHTYSETGMYTVTLTVTNDCGTAIATSDVNVVITNVDAPAWASKLWLSPNPTQGDLLLHAENWLGNGELVVYLTNTLGQRLQQQSLITNSGNWQHHLDLSNLPAGTYWLQLQWENSQWAQKIVKL